MEIVHKRAKWSSSLGTARVLILQHSLLRILLVEYEIEDGCIYLAFFCCSSSPQKASGALIMTARAMLLGLLISMTGRNAREWSNQPLSAGKREMHKPTETLHTTSEFLCR